jgi:hypothetical protein
MLKTKSMQSFINKLQRTFSQSSHDQQQQQQYHSGSTEYNHNLSSPLSSSSQAEQLTRSTGIMTTIDGKQYKVTISFNAQSISSCSIVPVPSFDEMVKSYRSKPQCLTLNDIDRLFAVHIILDNNEVPMDEECPICLSNFVPGNVVYVLPCSHFYHKPCIVPWVLHRNGNCPLCKTHFRPEFQQQRRQQQQM